MGTIGTLVLSAFLLLGGHEAGHYQKADSLRVPQEWIYGESLLYPVRLIPQTIDREDRSLISNAGFALEWRLSGHFEGTTLERDMRIIRALHGISYALSVRPDLKDLDRFKGREARKVAQASLILSSLSDLVALKRDMPFTLLYWQSSTGSPGLVVSISF